MSRRAHGRAIATTICLLVAVNVLNKLGPRHTMLVLGPLSIAALLVVARRSGLSWEALGLGRRHLGRGAAYAGVAVGAVAVAYVVAAQTPLRSAFLDERYQMPIGDALVTALVVIPISTVLPEEIAFRGVLWGLLDRDYGAARATVVSSALFGLWHILPSLRLHEVNPAVTAVVGDGWPAAAVAVTGAVLFTAAAGVVMCEARRRSGSLLAPIGLHWAVNGLGVLATAALSAAS